MDLSKEKELVNLAKTNDPDAFGQLFDEHYERIYCYLLKRTANPVLAEDLTSDTFFKALKNLDKFKWRGISFSSWLYRIAANEMNSYFRKQKGLLVSLQKILAESGDNLESLRTPHVEIVEIQQELERNTLYLQVRREITNLKPRYQEAISLRFFEKKKISEIAEILGKKEGTIKSLLSRGLGMIKDKFEEEPENSHIN